MKIIEINALENGAHRNQNGNFEKIPSGWAVIPENMNTINFPFGEIKVEEIDGIMTVTEWISGTIPKPDISIYIAKKENELSNACNKAIIAGIDVETTQGIEHFSLKETDQINLINALNAINQGIKYYPYHSDGNLCRIFTADEIITISKAYIKHKFYHTTLCNHLLIQVRRSTTINEIESITYDINSLSKDLAINVSNILSSIENINV